ncbi:MAG TPA: nucleotidyltransferase family protein [Nitrospiria bacterium]|nr:nucleotidyltransferase family protein [Nitrospiria bacterium]
MKQGMGSRHGFTISPHAPGCQDTRFTDWTSTRRPSILEHISMPMQTAVQRQKVTLARIACDAIVPQAQRWVPSTPSEWSVLLIEAGGEGIDGLLHDEVCRESPPFPPPPADIRRRMDRIKTHRLLDHHIKCAMLEEVLLHSAEKKLDLLIMQGMAITDELYPPGIRPLSDIDLLVRPDHFKQTERLLFDLGYTAVSRFPPVYVRDGICIDLHRQLASLSRVEPAANPLRIDETMLWTGAVRRPFGSAVSWSLAPIDQIVILSAHLQKHSFDRLIWFIDIGRLLNRLLKVTAFDVIRERAEQLGLDRPLYFVCAYLRTVLLLPSLLTVQLPAPSLTWLERRLYARLMADHRINGMGDLFYLMSVRPAALRRRFVRQVIFPKRDALRQEGRSVSPLGITWSYLDRLGRLSWRAVQLTGRLIHSGAGGDRTR